MTSLPSPHNAFGVGSLRPDLADGLPAGDRVAENLLVKAYRALLRGDSARAERLVDKAARIPWDAEGQHVPGVASAEFGLYMVIWQAFDDCDEGDGCWLDAPAAVIESDSPARQDVATAVRDVALEGGLTRLEQRRVDHLLAVCPPFDLDHEEGDLDHAARVQRIGTLLDALAQL